ncbi:TPA: hypothetical protein ACH3X2_011156 [Trebouxia sp. C0005]|nr:MAG: hypothetical protein FRX49_04248 [Trebouxia sp. A1-2]
MASYKLYLHLEGSRTLPDFTYIYRSTSNSQDSVLALLAEFCFKYNQKHRKTLSVEELQLVTENGRCPAVDSQVVKAFDRGVDIQVKVTSKPHQPRTCATSGVPCTAPASTRLEQLAAGLQISSTGQQTTQLAQSHETAHSDDTELVDSTPSTAGLLSESDGKVYLPIIKQFLERAKEAESKKYFRAACKIYEQVLKVAPCHKEALTAFAQLWLTVSRPKDAVKIAKKAASSAPDDPGSHRLYAQCLSECKQYTEALTAYNTALDLAKQRGDSIAVQDDMQVDIVRVLYLMGGSHKDTAAGLIMNVLRSNDHHQSGLIVYAKMASEGGMVRDAVQVLIRVLIRAPDDQEIRLTLAKCLQRPEGMAALRAELDGGGETDAAMAFLATAIKDHGAVPASNMLFRRALELKPSSPSYALNLMHGMELDQDYGKALQLALDFCRATKIETGGGLKVANVVQQLQHLPPLTSQDPLAWLHSESWNPQWTPHCSWGPTGTSPHDAVGTPASTMSDVPSTNSVQCNPAALSHLTTGPSVSSPPQAIDGLPDLAEGGLSGLGVEPASHGCIALGLLDDQIDVPSIEEQCGEVQKVEYTPTQLDFLALLFTVVKLLYIGGALPRCARVVHLLDSAARASAKELHKTLIRNEAAYFGCVKQLVLQHPPPPQPQAAGTLPLYLCGDSHCLSGAWNLVQVRGQPRVLVPCLVTGLKIWHMRQAGIFYPKHSFLTTMANLPDGAQVIFMFGEIDCREGLTMAVDKLKYETVDDAMDVLLHIYKDVLLKLVQERGFEMFVHPIAPVLNETRHVVAPFNNKLQQQIDILSRAPEAQGRLHWLDFFPDLLTPDGSSLNPALQFDGTHMSPYYVHFLNDQLAAIV